MTMKKKSKNYWPLILVAVFIPFAAGMVGTLKIAMSHPVAMDDSYLESYQKVDRHYNDFAAAQIEFSRDINGSLITPKMALGDNTLELSVIDKRSGMPVAGATIRGILTRPDTNALDRNLTFAPAGSGIYRASAAVDRPGRWQVKLRVDTGERHGMVVREYRIR